MNRAFLACVALAAAPAAAAVPRIESIVVKPNPAAFAGTKPPDVHISVTIERPSPLELSCDAVVDPGDGAAPLAVMFGVGDRRTKTVRHVYEKTGTYKITVMGAGSRACEGRRELSLTVQASGLSGAAGTESARCPRGWTLVPESVRGARYTCRAMAPVHPLKCEGGAKYFAENGVVGCR